MLAQSLADACGGDSSFLCRFIYSKTGSELLAGIGTAGVSIAVIVVLAWLITRLIRRQLPRFMEAVVARREEHETNSGRSDLTQQQLIERQLEVERARQRSGTLSDVLSSVLAGVVFFIALLVVLDQVGINLAPLLAGAGVVGIALGFGAQQVVRDFLAGMFIVFEDQFGVGDVVDLGEASGTVERINLRATRLRDVNGVVWYVPNGQITRVGNKSKLWSRAVLDIEVSYDTSIDQAGALLKSVADQLWQEKVEACTIISEPEFWGVEHFGADGITLRLVVRTEPTEQWSTARELRGRIKAAFDEANIEIPFPQRTVWLQTEQPKPHINNNE